MCGIIGIIADERDIAESAVAAGASSLAHRGPDAQGQEVVPLGGAWLGLGHRRLSILDLSPLGRQPMTHAPSGSTIIFNGEIYNFLRLRTELEREGEVFRTGTDTEVLLAGLARHGETYLTRLEGMYAFAFFDPRANTLLLARDPAGIKPLYLVEEDGAFVFASEARAILATGLIKPRINRSAIAAFLAYGAVQHPLTIHEGITSLPPGSFLKIRASRDRGWEKTGPPRAFWRLPEPRLEVTEAEAVAEVRQTLDAAVRDHLIADVPVGLFLSSGLDSTILAGLAARHSKSLKSFTVAFADRLDVDEGRLAAETASQFGLDHTEISISMASAEAAVEDWLAASDQPSIDGLNTFVISRAVRERGIKVALSGLGADELFGGYPSFRDVPRLRRLTRLTRPIPPRMRRAISGVATLRRSRVARAKLIDIFHGDGSIRSLALHRRRLMSNRQLAALGFTPSDLGLRADFLPEDSVTDVDEDGEADPIRLISQLEFRLYQANMLLRDSDVNGMASSLEIRVPFLDRRLLDLVHALPGSIRLPQGAAAKHLLRIAFPNLLSPCHLNQPKKGFTLPIAHWMAGSLRARCERALESLKESRLLSPAGIDTIWQSFIAEPSSAAWTRAFALVVLGEYWRRLVG